MLRSWSKTLHAGLFADHCWLEQGGRMHAASRAHELITDPARYLVELESMLAQAGKARKGGRLVVIVSDALATTIALPWQATLNGPDEVERYATLCFEKRGMELAEGRSLHAQFASYGAMGLAYALDSRWLAQLAGIVAGRGLVLSSVLPATAAAYFYAKSQRPKASEIILMCESTRLRALKFGPAGFAGCDAEPVTRSPCDALRRLMQRSIAADATLGAASIWTPAPDSLEPFERILADEYPAVLKRSLPAMFWSAL